MNILLILFLLIQYQVEEFEIIKRINFKRPACRTTIVLVALSSDQNQDDISLKLEWNWINRTLANIHYYNYANAVLLSYQKNTHDLEMWTYDFYPEYHLKVTSDVNDVLKDKGKDLMGYQIRMLSRNNFPLGYLVNGEFHGSGASFVDVMFEHFNASPKGDFALYDGVRSLSRIFESGDREICLFHIVYLKEINYTLSYLSMYLNAEFTIIIPYRVGSSVVSLSNSGVKLTLIIVILASLIWFFMPRFIIWAAKATKSSRRSHSPHRSFDTVLMICFAITVNVGVNITPQSRFDRIFLAGFLCFCFFAINGFQTDLISSMSTKQEFSSKIKSLAELEKSGMNIFLHKVYSENRTYKKLHIHHVDHFPWDYLHKDELRPEFEKYGHPAFILSNYKAQMFLNSSLNIVNGKPYFYQLEERFGPISLIINVVAPSVPYRRNLEILNLNLHENGFYSHWHEINLIEFSEHFGIKYNFDVDMEEDGIIKFDDLKIAFLIPIIGGMIGFVVLIIEILYAAFLKRRERKSILPS